MSSNDRQQGLTIIEILITVFVIGTVAVGVFGLFTLNLKSVQEAERKTVALALANEQAEKIRNLPYSQVGTVNGVPNGVLVPSQTITRNDTSYLVKVDIRYIDDPYDGTATSSPPDTVNADYKQARIELSWSAASAQHPLVTILQITPRGIEGGDEAGTLVFRALNAAGQPVPQANLRLVNSVVSPAIDVTTATDNSGYVVLPGLPPSSGSYQLTVTKNGYTTEQTYATTATFIPDADHANLSAIAKTITPKTSVIDTTSRLTVQTLNPSASPQPSITYSLQGTKSTGTDNQGNAVLRVNEQATTNAAGQSTRSDLLWDSYNLTINGVTTGYDIKETSAILPLIINPGDDITLNVTLVPHEPYSLHVTVVSPTQQPVDNATVRLFGSGYDKTLGTGTVGQVYFPETPLASPSPLPGAGSYTLEVSAPGYVPTTQPVSVAGTDRLRVQLSPAS